MFRGQASWPAAAVRVDHPEGRLVVSYREESDLLSVGRPAGEAIGGRIARQLHLVARASVDNPYLAVSSSHRIVGDPRAVGRDASVFVLSTRVRGQSFVRPFLEGNDIQILRAAELHVGDSPVAGHGWPKLESGRRRDL